MSEWKHVVADVESDGLLDALTRIWCLVLRDLDTDEVISCTDSAPKEWYLEKPNRHPMQFGYDLLARAERVYWHNGIVFDFPALIKVNGKEPHDRSFMRDTHVIAAMRWAHIKETDYDLCRRGKLPGDLRGSHKLEAWGYRLGTQKGEYTKWCEENGLDPWSEWRPEMQSYCEQDTSTGRALVLHIRRAGVSQQAVDIEHALAWYVAAQQRNGVPFDVERARDLQAKLAAERESISNELIELIGPRFKRNGKPVVPKIDRKKSGVVAGCEYSKIKLVEFKPSSRQDIAWVLINRYGWVPQAFGKDGAPTVDDEVLEGFGTDNPVVQKIRRYLMLDKRLGQIAEGKQAWFVHETTKGPLGGQITGVSHIHGRVKQNAAVTHRAAHSSPNLGQVPAVTSDYGPECRELFDVSIVNKSLGLSGDDEWVLIGSDASGLELRCLAHYMAKWDNGAYGEVVLNGDIHTVNQKAAGLATRAEAKTFIYAWLYGEGDEARGAKFLPKSASSEEKKKKGRAVTLQFLKGLPALRYLKDAVEGRLKRKGGPGYLKMPDGRRTYIRHEHAALNSLLQAAGAIICKLWIVLFSARLEAKLGPQGWNGQWAALLWVHDEVQIAVRRRHVEFVKHVLVDSIRSVTTIFNWRIPLDGEAKVGYNWKDTH